VSQTGTLLPEGIILPPTDKAIEERSKDFSDLLDQIDTLNDKKKRLWKEIYENACSDRQNAYAMFIQMCRIAKDASTEHAVHGKSIAAYLERMGRANEQLIRLADLIAKAESSEDQIDPDEVYDSIRK
jgi:hypothetical protein